MKKAYGKQVGIEVEVVERNPADAGFVPQAKRWIVEQTNGILMLHHQLVRDYEHRTCHPNLQQTRVPGVLGVKQPDVEDADWQPRPRLARSMTGGELTLGTLLVRLDEREREIDAQAEAAREEIAELTALLDGLDSVATPLRQTRVRLPRHRDGRRTPHLAPLMTTNLYCTRSLRVRVILLIRRRASSAGASMSASP
ncbi:hypothetical protein ACH4YO_42095 [Streptomyces noursei]|uniref:hypothetical protein n=1 Tax=Streptomyces noursei TaxID=1971 RepID=UPI0037AC35A2